MRNIENSYEKTFELFQQKLFITSFIVSFMAMLFEIIYIPMCYTFKIKELDIPFYILRFIVVPSSVNFTFWFSCKWIYNKGKVGKKIRLLTPVILFTLICSNIVRIHIVFPVLYAIFIIPIFISLVYGNNVIERDVLIITLFWMTVTYIVAHFQVITTNPENYNLNVVLSYFLVFLTHIIAKTILKFEKRKEIILNENVNYSKLLEEENTHDSLTKLHNRKALMDFLEENKDKGLHMAVIDIDFFKKVNDTYGHKAGDNVLIGLSSLLRDLEKTYGVFCARYGGEEFVVVFIECSTKECQKILNITRKTLKEIKFEGIDRTITFSAGLAKHIRGMSFNKLFERADSALYEAKENGRNRVIVKKDY